MVTLLNLRDSWKHLGWSGGGLTPSKDLCQTNVVIPTKGRWRGGSRILWARDSLDINKVLTLPIAETKAGLPVMIHFPYPTPPTPSEGPWWLNMSQWKKSFLWGRWRELKCAFRQMGSHSWSSIVHQMLLEILCTQRNVRQHFQSWRNHLPLADKWPLNWDRRVN